MVTSRIVTRLHPRMDTSPGRPGLVRKMSSSSSPIQASPSPSIVPDPEIEMSLQSLAAISARFGPIETGFGAAPERRPRLDVQIDVRLEIDRAGQIGPSRGQQDPAPAGVVAGVDGLLNRGGIVRFAVARGPILQNAVGPLPLGQQTKQQNRRGGQEMRNGLLRCHHDAPCSDVDLSEQMGHTVAWSRRQAKTECYCDWKERLCPEANARAGCGLVMVDRRHICTSWAAMPRFEYHKIAEIGNEMGQTSLVDHRQGRRPRLGRRGTDPDVVVRVRRARTSGFSMTWARARRPTSAAPPSTSTATAGSTSSPAPRGTATRANPAPSPSSDSTSARSVATTMWRRTSTATANSTWSPSAIKRASPHGLAGEPRQSPREMDHPQDRRRHPRRRRPQGRGRPRRRRRCRRRPRRRLVRERRRQRPPMEGTSRPDPARRQPARALRPGDQGLDLRHGQGRRHGHRRGRGGRGRCPGLVVREQGQGPVLGPAT